MEATIIEKCDRNDYFLTHNLIRNKTETTDGLQKLDQFITFMRSRGKRKNEFKIKLSFDVSLSRKILNP